jgi:hypothetical protein
MSLSFSLRVRTGDHGRSRATVVLPELPSSTSLVTSLPEFAAGMSFQKFLVRAIGKQKPG